MRFLRTNSFFLCVALAVAGIVLLSCTKSSGEDEGDYNSSFYVKSKVLKIDLTGGDLSVDYSIDGPMEGSLAELSTDTPWIHLGNVYNSEFGCTIDPNDSGRDRTGRIVLKCRQTRPLEIIVIQSSKKDETPIYRNFRIEVSDITTSTCRVRVMPVDAGKTYIWTPVRKADYDKSTPEEHIKACIAQVEDWAVKAGSTPDKFLQSGTLDTESLPESQRPSLFDRTDYYMAVFDISYDKLTKKFSYSGNIDLVAFRTKSAPASEMKFEILYDGGILTIRPDRDEKYVFSYVTKSAWDSVDPDYAAQYYIAYSSALSGMLETHEGLYRVDLTKDTTMKRGERYVAFAVGYRDSEDDGGLTTEVQYVEFTYNSSLNL